MMSPQVTPRPGIYGVAATFSSPDALREAARAVRRAGYRRLSAYTPFPVDGLAEEVGFRFNWLPIIVTVLGLSGAAGAYWILWFACVKSYPLNVAGRPLNSWPSFIPITFEMGVLTASLTAIAALILLCGLPRPHHPIFSAPNFTRLGRGRFVLCIEARDRLFEPGSARELLQSLGAQEVSDVPNA